MRAAFEVVRAEADLLQPSGDCLDMLRFSVVRRTGEGDFLVAQPDSSAAPVSMRGMACTALIADRGNTGSSALPQLAITWP